MKTTVTPQWRDGMWKVRVTDPNPDAVPRRPWVPIEGVPLSDPALAQRKANVIVEIVRANGIVSITGGETVDAWIGRWFSWRESRVERVKTARGQYDLHVRAVVGHLPMSAIGPEHGRRIVDVLDALVAAGKMEWKTAINVWSIMSKAMKDAAGAKSESLRVLEANPFAGVAGPDRGQAKQRQYLYPEDLLALVACEAIPLWRRRVYAFAVYSYVRAGELAALRWPDVDAVRGHVSVHDAVSRYGKRSEEAARRAGGDGTKSEQARRYTLEPEILPMLQAMLEEADDVAGLVFQKLPPYHGRDGQAPTLRADLLKAGVRRAALHESTRTRKRLTFHDLRATACTWAAIRGDSPMKIMARSGHETLEVLMGYVREAEAVRDGFGDVFPPLPAELGGGEIECPGSVPSVPELPKNLGKMATPTGIERLAGGRVSPRNDVGSAREGPPGVSRGVEPRSPEADLAEALRLAAAAERWDIVAQLSRQLAVMQDAAGGGPKLRALPDDDATGTQGRR